MAGLPIGLDLPAALSVGQALGYDQMALAMLLPIAEGAVVAAIQEHLKDGGD